MELESTAMQIDDGFGGDAFNAPIPRSKVMQLQEAISALPQVDCPVTHHFSKGVYARELLHPAGVALVGCEHLTEHLFILAKGRVTISTDEGMRDIEGPCVLNTVPGMKRVAYAHEDSTVITIHVTDLTDPDAIMRAITKPEPGNPFHAVPAGDLP